MIDIQCLEKTYSNATVTTPVLKDINFNIDEGEYVALMGTSGTGKSTLMNILGCLDKPTNGTYRLDGVDVSSLDDDALSHLRNRKIGFVFQQFHLLERATAMSNVMLPLIYVEDYPEDAEEKAEKTLSSVGLADRMGYKPNELSGGQQQRVAIARALITDPEMILADEPTGNLDRQSGLEILVILKRLHTEGRTIILVTHDMSVAEHAQRIIVLKDGSIAEDKKVEDPRDPEEELNTLAGEEEEE
jgi:putative ABC transport system ATP-binding protein